ncbi:hypothetical protein Tco_0566156 [Tanacetum coccineum]
MDNGACIRIRNNSQQVGDVTEVEQLDELTSQLSDNETDEPGPQDIYFKVMGNNSNETAEMYGLGVCASDVWGVVLSCSARRRDKFQWKSTAGQLSVELAQYKVKELQRQGSSLNDSNGTNAPSTSPKSLVVAIESQPLRVGLQVYLKSISISEIVAKGECLARKLGVLATLQYFIGVTWRNCCMALFFVTVVVKMMHELIANIQSLDQEDDLYEFL